MLNTYEKMSVLNNFFSGTIEGDKVFSTDIYGHKKIVGYTIDAYNEATELLDIYYNKLVELGVIVKEKTQEEVIKEQQDMIKQMMQSITELNKKVEKLGEVDGHTEDGKHNLTNNESEQRATQQTDGVNRESKIIVE